MSVLRQWRVLACLAPLLGCGNGTKGQGTTPEGAEAGQSGEPAAEEATTPEDSQGFSLPDPKCDEPIVTYRGRAVVTIDGVDSPNRVDIIAKAPDASAKVACELALKSHHMTGNLDQRVLRECSTDEIAMDRSKAGWDLVNPTIADGLGLRMLVGKADDVEMADCTSVALVYLSNYPGEKACTDLVNTMAEMRERSSKASHDAVTSFLDKELERVAANIKESCPKVDVVEAQCTAIHDVAKNVGVVCERPASKGCTRAKEAAMLFEECQLRHRRTLQDCESSKLSHEELQKTRDAPPEKTNEPLPYCRPASA